ncbi:MAG: phosphopantothenoylcysteine decarboxylase [Victivallaceae bacterium]|nr:phosphopantothenoylcysteine decarboxylase [Victivallaceae bacterium]
MKKERPVIALGVTGGIAACKSAELCGKLVQTGFPVRVLMTENATRFVTPLTFRTLSRNDVILSLWEGNGDWRPAHIALADEAEIFVVAPASADFIAKYACGIADDALTTFAAAFDGKTLLVPAMNPKMWAHAACRENVEKLAARGVAFCGPVRGRVACGAVGVGRMAEVDAILAAIGKML